MDRLFGTKGQNDREVEEQLPTKESDLAVMIFRSARRFQWDLVEQAMLVGVNRRVYIKVVGDDCALLTCANMVEKHRLVSEGKTIEGI